MQQQQQRSSSRWAELVTENPVYRREQLQVVVPANFTEEKTKDAREKRRKDLALWDDLSWPRKLWRLAWPQFLLFGIGYVALPFLAQWLERTAGAMVGPIITSLLVSSSAAAGAIVGEREKRTWNALLLSGLSPEQILGGKVAFLLKGSLMMQLSILSFGLAALARNLIPPGVLFLLGPLLLSHNILGIVVGLRTSLWSANLQAAVRRTTWQGAGLMVLTLLALAAGLVALLGKAPLGLLLVPVVYFFFQLTAAWQIWKTLLREIYAAPKDFSG